jgi:hypothetical protein
MNAGFDVYITTTETKKLKDLIDEIIKANENKFEQMDNWHAKIIEEERTLIEDKNTTGSTVFNADRVSIRGKRMRKVSNTRRPNGCNEHGVQSNQCGHTREQSLQSMGETSKVSGCDAIG